MIVLHWLFEATVLVLAYAGTTRFVNKWHERRDRKQAENAPQTVKDRVVAGERITYPLKPDEPLQYAPRPIDPQNPPKWLVYNPKRPGAMAFCTNCQDALDSGDRVLMVPHSGRAPELICEGCVQTQ